MAFTCGSCGWCRWPPAAEAHAGLRGPFVILEFDGEAALVVVENHRTGLFLEEAADLAGYRLALGNILNAALIAAVVVLPAPAATMHPGYSVAVGGSRDVGHLRERSPGPGWPIQMDIASALRRNFG